MTGFLLNQLEAKGPPRQVKYHLLSPYNMSSAKPLKIFPVLQKGCKRPLCGWHKLGEFKGQILSRCKLAPFSWHQLCDGAANTPKEALEN